MRPSGWAINQRIERYIRRRTPPATPPLRVSRRRLYILPTTSGMLFALLMAVMLLGATNYGNNLAFTLAFWLGSAALVSMHRAHRNLAGLELRQVSVSPAFAGQTLCYRLTFQSRARLARRHLAVFDLAGAATTPIEADRHITVSADRPHIVACHTTAVQRGYQRCPRWRIESRYPMGLFCAWTHMAPDVSALVYPAPAGSPTLPRTAGQQSGPMPRAAQGGEDFIAHRRYQTGDSLRHIDWKASARSGQWLVTEHADTCQPAYWFDYEALAGQACETRLSQLALWVVNAEAAGQRYALVLPRQRIGPDSGRRHYHACLTALALFA